ncbi:pentatricopeptide repeat-containing protein At1g30610, chloroplastic isoform X2 [Apium graveolens]|uniref:pentatricopeptide repeat-containing protein At1g30610, chloroplastic isoform X2 n=1 Tax=Apium graveolens TaxID=4045 RepID=UPI003D790524
MVVILHTNTHMGIKNIESLGSFHAPHLKFPSGFLISKGPIFSFGFKKIKKFEQKHHGVLIGYRNPGKFSVVMKGGSGDGGVIEKELEFKPSFDEYLKAMESVQSVRDKRKKAKNRVGKSGDDSGLGVLEKREEKVRIEDGNGGGLGRKDSGFEGSGDGVKRSEILSLERRNDKGGVVKGGGRKAGFKDKSSVGNVGGLRCGDSGFEGSRVDDDVERRELGMLEQENKRGIVKGGAMKIGLRERSMKGNGIGSVRNEVEFRSSGNDSKVERKLGGESRKGRWVNNQNGGLREMEFTRSGADTRVERKLGGESRNGRWVNNQNGGVRETLRIDKSKGETYGESYSYRTSGRDHFEGGKNYAQSAQGIVRRGRVGKRGYEDSGETDRAAFRSLEDFNDIDDKPRVSRVDMEERIQKLAKSLNGADIGMPEWMFSKIMRSAKIRFADHSMLRVIQILGKFGNWRRVLQVIEWIQSRERFKSHKLRFIYTAALDALGKARRPVEALNLFNMMQKQMSTYPDLVAYHCIAVTLGQAGHLKELFDVIDSMQSSPKKKFETGVIGKWDPRLKPDIVVFNAVLNACVHRKKWEGAFWVLQQMKEVGQQPTTTTYGLIMEVMFACGKYNLVHDFFKKVHKSANALTYKVLVNTHWKEGNIDLAIGAVKEMEGRGIIGSGGLYYDLARGLCSAGRCQEALVQVEKVCRVATKPLVVTYTGLVQTCLDSGNIQNAVYIFKHMHKFCSPNLVTCNIMLKAYLDHEMFEEANELFQKLLESGNYISSKSDYKERFIPDNYTFNLMLDACAAQQRWDDLEFIYRRMLQHEYHFNTKRHLRIILDACRAGKMELLETTWKHLSKADRLPPPLLVKQMFCLKLEQKDYAAAFACVTNHPSCDLPEFSHKSWLLFFKENSHRLQEENLVDLVHEINNVYTRSDSPNLILENLKIACREFLRTCMKVNDFDQSLEARMTLV